MIDDSGQYGSLCITVHNPFESDGLLHYVHQPWQRDSTLSSTSHMESCYQYITVFLILISLFKLNIQFKWQRHAITVFLYEPHFT